MDQFLAERIIDLQQIANIMDLEAVKRAGGLESVLKTFQPDPWFTDLGIIDHDGRRLAYTGPYDLISKNYKNAVWFKAIMKRDVYISNVFSGFRNVPHFIFAVKQDYNGKKNIPRATVNAAFFGERVMAVTKKWIL